MNTCAVYHWWDEPNDSPAYANLRAPLIVSIATLRAVNPEIPIVVLDIGTEEREWKHFPEKLNFSVEKIEPNLADCQDRVPGWKHLSRITDVHTVEADSLMYVDTDVFWLEDPLPLYQNDDRFCFNGWNTGFYYYRKDSNVIKEFMKIFQAYTRAAIYSSEVREIMKQYVGYDDWYGVWDEMILTYMVHQHPKLFTQISSLEYMSGRGIEETGAIRFKMFHANGTMVANKVPKTPNEAIHCRGLLGLLIKEIYRSVLQTLGEEDMKLVYSPQELATYLPQQSPMRGIDWKKIKREDGHYHIQDHARPSKFVI